MPEKLYISRIVLPGGQAYEIKDAEAWRLIAEMAANSWSFKISKDAASTPYGVTWDNGEEIITGTLVADGSIHAIYLVPAYDPARPEYAEGDEYSALPEKDIYDEWVCADDGEEGHPHYVWEKLGNTEIDFDGLGSLAWKNSAQGTISINTVDSASVIDATVATSATYTPAGSIDVDLAYTDTLASLTKADYTPAGSVTSTNSYTDTAATLTKADYTPAGTNDAPSITVTKPTEKIEVKLTDGQVTAGVAASFTEGTFHSGSFTQGTDSFTAPTLTTSVSDETLTIAFDAGSFTQGTDSYTSSSKDADTFTANTPTAVTLPTFQEKDLVKADTLAAALDRAPIFTGTKADDALVTAVNYDKANASVTSTFAGTTESNALVTAVNYDKAEVDSQVFTGTEATINPTGTANGDVTLTKSDKTKTVTVR